MHQVSPGNRDVVVSPDPLGDVHVTVMSNMDTTLTATLSPSSAMMRLQHPLSRSSNTSDLSVNAMVPQVTLPDEILQSQSDEPSVMSPAESTSVMMHCLSESYVDDTKLYISFPIQDWVNAVSEINGDLIRIRNWCFDKSSSPKPDKTKLMLYGSRQMLSKLPDVRLSLLAKDILPAKVVKDLGVTFDPNLTFT
ncbi:hypothetical protein OS493_016577 [Desmophyllum pertusum]|uniref:Uncharacterized protein n=1 Tax=Desmophyllum pertusum TaxID=174260 RepID=A0A9W9ZEX0_9CNID|nr:hypothetical protein OS493_016577 [Desmophyllum pertusum]